MAIVVAVVVCSSAAATAACACTRTKTSSTAWSIDLIGTRRLDTRTAHTFPLSANCFSTNRRPQIAPKLTVRQIRSRSGSGPFCCCREISPGGHVLTPPFLFRS
ncbi:hypothetical protein M441DRAFT_230258 [Trichoderma asperellum CBS 433.97]|uniref:Secreted protein n=1 Tax=Trichoderma asperellum (strain ATCC 204424 / CBS 433.97 / NBRC 101777) TaxID=1042311 RepID=A0A2T3ZQM1_TRIA4|nr:hypothetical protein M441DRAFT_230258 [Trichoderma asperellum CBS 433.97]PTB47064.1 hypothetical protein M441DRAFT_230258 [Trichoderma asperellum CBS 433.97]